MVLTGDYITYDFAGTYRKKVVSLLGNIESRFGTYACLGNHDYGIRILPDYKREHLLRRLMQAMEAKGMMRKDFAVGIRRQRTMKSLASPAPQASVK